MIPKISKKLSSKALEFLFYPDESENSIETFGMHDSLIFKIVMVPTIIATDFYKSK